MTFSEVVGDLHLGDQKVTTGRSWDIHMCHGQKVAILGMVIPPFIGILIMGI